MNRRLFLKNTFRGTAGAAAITHLDRVGAADPGGVATESLAPALSTTTLLFFDDWPLNRRDHVARRIGAPQRVAEATFVDPHLNATWGYPSVFRDPETRRWRCLYQGWDQNRKRVYPVLAESADGVAWRVAELSGRIAMPGRAHPHQVLPVEDFDEWSPCYYDALAQPDERLKGLVISHGKGYSKSHLWVSPDGIRWRRIAGVEWQRPAPDPVTCVFWNAVRSSYVLTTRPDGTDRRISLVETKDWRRFTEPELAMQADAQDTPLAETYGMPVFPYEGLYVGLLWIFHVSPDVAGQSPHKFWRGKLDSQLAYSRNGWHFQRALREPFIPNAEPGEYGAGCLQPASLILDDDGRIRIYSSAAKYEHGVPTHGDGAIIMHTLRRDGFVYLESTGGQGTVGTRSLHWRGGTLKINLASSGGEARLQITDSQGVPLAGYAFDDSEPFTGDALDWQPQWKGGRTTATLPERTLRVEVRLLNARLYAIRGRFSVLTGAETHRYESLGEQPRRRPGF